MPRYPAFTALPGLPLAEADTLRLKTYVPTEPVFRNILPPTKTTNPLVQKQQNRPRPPINRFIPYSLDGFLEADNDSTRALRSGQGYEKHESSHTESDAKASALQIAEPKQLCPHLLEAALRSDHPRFVPYPDQKNSGRSGSIDELRSSEAQCEPRAFVESRGRGNDDSFSIKRPGMVKLDRMMRVVRKKVSRSAARVGIRRGDSHLCWKCKAKDVLYSRPKKVLMKGHEKLA